MSLSAATVRGQIKPFHNLFILCDLMESNPDTGRDAAGGGTHSDRAKQAPPRVMKEYSEEQRKRRATTILDNYQLLMKYALENQKVSGC